MMPTVESLYEVTERTWPSAEVSHAGGFTFRRGDGGGQRVSATTLETGAPVGDLAFAEARMRGMGQPLLFMIRAGETDLDQALAARGYRVHDAVNLYCCPVDLLTDHPVPPVTTFNIWEPLAIQREIWQAGGVGAGRLAVMDRAPSPKTTILARWNEKPAGTGYVGIHDGIAMIHAIEILQHQRRQGVAGWMLRAAAFWARDNGAQHFALVTTQANTASNRLYASAGMTLVGQYHYRLKETDQ